MLTEVRETGLRDPLLISPDARKPYRISRSTIILLCCTAAMVIGAVTLSLRSFNQVSELTLQRLQTHIEIDAINQLLSSLKDAETAQRGYLLTGDETYLAPYYFVQDRLTLQLKELQARQVSDSSRKLIDEVELLTKAKMAELAGTIDMKRRHESEAAISSILNGNGKQLMDKLRADIAEISQEQQRIWAQESRQDEIDQRHLFEGIVATSFLALLLSLTTGWLAYRNARHYVDKLQLNESTRLLEMQRQSNEELWKVHIQLMKNREQLRAFIQHAPVGMAMFDLDMNYLAVSDNWKECFESWPGELIGRNHYELNPDLPEQWKVQHRMALSGAKLNNPNDRWLRSDGRVQWISWALQPWMDETGMIAGIIIAAEDITERRNLEALQQEADKRLHAVIDSAMDAIITIDESSVIQLFNPAACSMYGTAESDAVGSTIDRFIPARFRRGHLQHIHEFDSSGIPLRYMGSPRDIVGLRANGQEFPGEATISQVTVSGKKLFTVIIRDQTNRLLAEQALRDSEAFNVATLNSVGAEIAVLNHDGTIMAVNQSWMNFAKQNCFPDGSIRKAVQVGTNYLEVCKDSMVVQAYEGIKSVMEGSSAGFNMSYPRESTTGECWFQMSVTPMATSDGKVVVSHTDITTIKLTEKALQASQETLRDLLEYQHRKKEEERIKIAQVIHDQLGTRLTAAKANLSVLMDQDQRSGVEANPRLRDACALLDASFDTVRNVILDLRPSVLDNLGIWSALEWYAGKNAKNTGIYCDFFIEPTLGDHVPVPELSTALFRILQEALSNVTRHAQATEVAVRVSTEQQFIKMEVADNGTGIDMAKVHQFKSWGITGMAERARYLGGSVDITQTESGTLITVLLPLVTAEE